MTKIRKYQIMAFLEVFELKGCQKVLWVRLPEREVQHNDTRRK